MKNDKIKILLVDDRPEGLMALELVLRSPHYELLQARSGDEALARILDEDVAVILLDVQMPGMDGFETAHLIKKHDRFRHIPIIFVTGIHNDSRFINQGYQSGAIDYVIKPFDPYVLRSKVDVLVELHRKTLLLHEMTRREHELALAQTKRQLVENFQVREKQLISLVENSTDFIAIANRDFQLTYLNQAGRKLVGIDSDYELKLTHIKEFLKPGEWDRMAVEIIPPLMEKGSWEDELCFRHFSNGNFLPVWSRGFLITNPHTGEIDAIATVSRDITEKKRAEKALRETADRLTRSNEELKEFAWIASHDLKEPIRVISTYVQLLDRKYGTSLNSDAKDIMGVIGGAAKRMYSLINDLLLLSSLHGNSPELEEVDCNQVIDEVMGNLKVTIQESKAQIERGNLPCIRGEATQLAQLFQNLIANAIKFRGDCEPRIKIDAEYRGHSLLFGVRDNGIGIEPQYVSKIFGIFQRIHSDHEYPGTGIGLSICKRVVERHGGTIWVDSTPGCGSTFYFTLPVPANETRALVAHTASA
jgi:PAS domain S-box-containing protein